MYRIEMTSLERSRTFIQSCVNFGKEPNHRLPLELFSDWTDESPRVVILDTSFWEH